MRIGRWYVVTWQDAWSKDSVDWKNPKKIDLTPLVCISAGRLVKQNKHSICLAQTVDTNSGRASCFMIVPRGMITKVAKITP